MYFANSQLTHTGFSTGLYVLHTAATKVYKSVRQYKADQKQDNLYTLPCLTFAHETCYLTSDMQWSLPWHSVFSGKPC
jgi:hypothetical protein